MRTVLPATHGKEITLTVYRDGVPMATLLVHDVNPATLIEAELRAPKSAAEFADMILLDRTPKHGG